VAKKSISLETTLSGSTILKRIRAAKDAGYDIELRYIALATVDLHVKRVEQRVRLGGHAVPVATIVRRYHDSLRNLPEAVKLAGRLLVIDNSGREKRFLLRMESGQILERDTEPPNWLLMRLPAILSALNLAEQERRLYGEDG